jgi:hypothetical protein
MEKTLERAVARAAALPEAAQAQLGREMLARIGTLAALRTAVETGLRELGAGEGTRAPIEEIIAEARKEHGGR